MQGLTFINSCWHLTICGHFDISWIVVLCFMCFAVCPWCLFNLGTNSLRATFHALYFGMPLHHPHSNLFSLEVSLTMLHKSICLPTPELPIFLHSPNHLLIDHIVCSFFKTIIYLFYHNAFYRGQGISLLFTITQMHRIVPGTQLIFINSIKLN